MKNRSPFRKPTPLVSNAARQVGSALLKLDPSQTRSIRQPLIAEINRRIRALTAGVLEEFKGLTANVFCPTGEGGGVDPSCGKGGVSVSSDGSGTIKDKNGVSYPVLFEARTRTYSIGVPGKESMLERGVTAGGATMKRVGDVVSDVGIHKEFRRKGLASALYAHIEKHIGKSLRPNDYLTPDGEALWASRKPTTNQVTPSFDSLLQKFTSGKWWTGFVEAAYLKGVTRAYDSAHPNPTRDGRNEFLRMMSLRNATEFTGNAKRHSLKDIKGKFISAKALQLAQRFEAEIKGVGQWMGQQLGRIVTDAMMNGTPANELAVLINKVMHTTKNRCIVIANTEIIRAQAEGQLDAAEALGIDEVEPEVEWITAGMPCPSCSKMRGKRFKVSQAHGLIPHHPSCKCSWKIVKPKKVKKSLTGNMFCPTGEGGGIDPSCSPNAKLTSLPEAGPNYFAQSGQASLEDLGFKGLGVSYGARGKYGVDLVEQTLDPSQINFVQSAVSKQIVADKLSGSNRDLPVIVKDGNQYHLQEGHHRAAAQVLQTGRVTALVVEVESKRGGKVKFKTPTTDVTSNRSWGFVTRALLKFDAVANVFCPTGEGGGVDPSCKWTSNETPFRTASHTEIQEVGRATEKSGLGRMDGVSRQVPLDSVVGTQRKLWPKRVQEYIKNPNKDSDAAVTATKYKGTYYVTEGHHRVTAAIARGEKTTEIHVYDLDAVTVNVFCPTGTGGGVDPSCRSGGNEGDYGRLKNPITQHETTYKSIPNRNSEIANARNKLAFKNGHSVQMLDPSTLVSSQDWLISDMQSKMVGELYKDKPILVIRHEGKLHVEHGNHRAAHALLTGQMVPAVVAEWANDGKLVFQTPTINVFCPTGEGGGIDPTCKTGGGSHAEKTKAMLAEAASDPALKSLTAEKDRIKVGMMKRLDAATKSKKVDLDKAMADYTSSFREFEAAEAKVAERSRELLVKHFGIESKKQPKFNVDTGKSGPHAENWQKAEEFLKPLSARTAIGHQTLEVRPTRTLDERSSYTPGKKAGVLDKLALLGDVKGRIRSNPKDTPSIAAHEFGHHLEESIPGAKAKVAEFRQKRYDPAKNVSLKESAPFGGFHESEVGNPDNMEPLFQSKAKAAYSGKVYKSGSTEILSMGIEALHSNPIHMAKTDPEYFGLVMGILQGDK